MTYVKYAGGISAGLGVFLSAMYLTITGVEHGIKAISNKPIGKVKVDSPVNREPDWWKFQETFERNRQNVRWEQMEKRRIEKDKRGIVRGFPDGTFSRPDDRGIIQGYRDTEGKPMGPINRSSQGIEEKK